MNEPMIFRPDFAAANGKKRRKDFPILSIVEYADDFSKRGFDDYKPEQAAIDAGTSS